MPSGEAPTKGLEGSNSKPEAINVNEE